MIRAIEGNVIPGARGDYYWVRVGRCVVIRIANKQ